jgi:hypothetical protein
VCGGVLGLAGACRISNDDHCVHKDLDGDAWCAREVPGRPFCSPCAADRHGCVAAPPDDCPADEDDASTGAGPGPGADADADADVDAGTG